MPTGTRKEREEGERKVGEPVGWRVDWRVNQNRERRRRCGGRPTLKRNGRRRIGIHLGPLRMFEAREPGRGKERRDRTGAAEAKVKMSVIVREKWKGGGEEERHTAAAKRG